jgi:hypothetical protein
LTLNPAPVTAAPEIVRSAAPELVTVMVAVACAPVATSPKFTVSGATAALGTAPAGEEGWLARVLPPPHPVKNKTNPASGANGSGIRSHFQPRVADRRTVFALIFSIAVDTQSFNNCFKTELRQYVIYSLIVY